jgi:O-antigen ligase
MLDMTLEYLFYGNIIYSLLSIPFKIYLPYLATIWLVFICISSVFEGDWQKPGKLLVLLICATAGSHLMIQVIIHHVSIRAPYNQPFLFWIIMILPVYTLSRKPGFIKRLALVMLAIGLILRFFLVFKSSGQYTREALSSGSGIDNANDYAAWLAFCCLIFWLFGWKEPGKIKRLFMWGCSLISFLFMIRTVSRGALLALSVSSICGLRSIPRKYWFRIILVIALIYLAFEKFSFNREEINNYQIRLYEDSGRSKIWSAALPLIKAHPWFGYGTNVLGGFNKWTYGYRSILPISSPHNPYLMLMLGSGIIPTILFSLLWIIAFYRSIHSRPNSSQEVDPFPLVVFGFLITFVVNTSFAYVWCCAILANSYFLHQAPLINDKRI